MSNLTDTAEDRALTWILTGSATAPTLPLKLALVTVAGSDSAAGTEVAGGSYARQTITPTAVSSGAASNSNLITFTGMPTCTVVGWEIWDSAGTPIRWWHGTVTSKAYTSGDDAAVAIGDLDIALA